ncbi:DUF11 domain-containing protein [Candidatus Nomurabacteria bacterium]|nr:DUF11 domain-containing protein [Candidatus Nomurabacteria bacterium]
MKTKIQQFIFAVAILSIFFTGATNASAQYAVPTCSSATLNGTVIPNGASTIAWFDWGVGSSLANHTDPQTFSTTQAYSQVIYNLQQNTTYSFRAMASNVNGTATGQTFTFTTSSCNTTPQTCQDPAATNFGGPLPCTYPTAQLCQDPTATNYHGPLPCTYPPQLCQDPTANNYGGPLPCTYPTPVNKTATLSINKTAFKVGENWTLSINSNIYNGTVTICSRIPSPSGNSCTPAANLGFSANTNSYGSWSGSGSHATSAIGSWDEYAIVSGTNTNDIYFTVADQVPQNLPMSGTLTPATSNCVITAGQNSCTINFTWNTINPVATSSVTSAGVTVANGNSSPSPFPFVIPFGSKTFYLYNNAILLAQSTVSALCASGTSWNGGVCQTSTTPVQTCQDPSATNYGGTLPCRYSQPTSSVSAGVNYVYGTNTNTNTSTGGTSTNTNTSTGGTSTNTNTNTNNNNPIINVNVNGGGDGVITQTCRDTSATNYGGSLPCNYYYAPQVCQDSSAINYHGTLPCTYYNYNYNYQTCQDPSAINYRGILPCTYYNYNNYNNVQTYQNNFSTGQQPTVVVFANHATVPYNSAATVSWITTNATSCSASGGSTGWAGVKSIGPGSFYTGSLTSSQTYTLTCNNNFGSATDSVTVNVTRQTVITPGNPITPTSLVLITSSIDRNQPIVPTLDNSRPHPGDEINYTVSYQNVGTGSITGLTLRINLPPEVDYMFSTPNNPIVTGQTLIFNLGTLRANGQGTVTARVRVRDNIPENTNLDFPATLSYIDPSGIPQSVVANVSAQVWQNPAKINANTSALGAGIFGSGIFLPVTLLGWLILIILILILIYLSRHAYAQYKK